MIEIIEIIWKHPDAPPNSMGAPTRAEKTTDDDGDGDVSNVDVGGDHKTVLK